MGYISPKVVTPQRNSSIELLRIVCMLFIVVHHILCHGMRCTGYYGTNSISWWAVFINPFLMCSVNCFVLISGYFKIKSIFSKSYRLWIQCAFWGAFAYLLHLYLDGQHLGKSFLLNTIPVFSNPPGWWFIKIYAQLILFSPILNKASELMQKKDFQIVLCLIYIIDFYFMFLSSQTDGHNLIHFSALYLTGRYIANYSNTNKSQAHYISVYLLCGAFLGLTSICTLLLRPEYTFVNLNYSYSNPVLFLESVAFFIFFKKMRIESSKINSIASSSLAIYLFHENVYIKSRLYSWIGDTIQVGDPASTFIWITTITAAIFCIAIVLDKLRIVLLKPIDNYITNHLKQVDALIKV